MPLFQNKNRLTTGKEYKNFTLRRFEKEINPLENLQSIQEITLHFRTEIFSQEHNDSPKFMEKINLYKIKSFLTFEQAVEIFDEI